MNEINGSCSVCGTPTQYTGKIPILCESCKGQRQQIASGDVAALQFRNYLNPRLFLPDSELMPKPKTIADFQ